MKMTKENKLDHFQIGIVCGLLWKESKKYEYNTIERLLLKTLMPKTYGHNLAIKTAVDNVSNRMFGSEVIVRKIKI